MSCLTNKLRIGRGVAVGGASTALAPPLWRAAGPCDNQCSPISWHRFHNQAEQHCAQGEPGPLAGSQRGPRLSQSVDRPPIAHPGNNSSNEHASSGLGASSPPSPAAADGLARRSQPSRSQHPGSTPKAMPRSARRSRCATSAAATAAAATAAAVALPRMPSGAAPLTHASRLLTCAALVAPRKQQQQHQHQQRQQQHQQRQQREQRERWRHWRAGAAADDGSTWLEQEGSGPEAQQQPDEQWQRQQDAAQPPANIQQHAPEQPQRPAAWQARLPGPLARLAAAARPRWLLPQVPWALNTTLTLMVLWTAFFCAAANAIVPTLMGWAGVSAASGGGGLAGEAWVQALRHLVLDALMVRGVGGQGVAGGGHAAAPQRGLLAAAAPKGAADPSSVPRSLTSPCRPPPPLLDRWRPPLWCWSEAWRPTAPAPWACSPRRRCRGAAGCRRWGWGPPPSPPSSGCTARSCSCCRPRRRPGARAAGVRRVDRWLADWRARRVKL